MFNIPARNINVENFLKWKKYYISATKYWLLVNVIVLNSSLKSGTKRMSLPVLLGSPLVQDNTPLPRPMLLKQS